MVIQEVRNFLENKSAPIIDVRSPAEFQSGHIPGAINIPLFSDEERAIVGKSYKQSGKDTALKKGLTIVGPKMVSMLEQLEKVNTGKELRLYCWRGGMRSSSMAWLFETAEYSCQVLKGGYKSYRGLMNVLFNNLDIILIGGNTGSGKTEVLYELKDLGAQIVDLEGLANHKGSAFGSVGMPPQPTNEQFQNLVIEEFLTLDNRKQIFLEDESAHIGKVSIPESLWTKMKSSPLISLSIPMKARVDRLVEDYGNNDRSELEACIRKIERKLGGQNVKAAIKQLHNGDLASVAGLMLHYYDKSYELLINRKESNIIARIGPGETDPRSIANRIIQVLEEVEMHGRS